MNECKILMADDDFDDRTFFKEALEVVGQSTLIQFEDGIELIKALNNMTVLPKVIFLDLNMPLKDGIECLMEIRDNKRYEVIPIVIYTTSSNSLHIEKTYKLGANLYIAKPNDYKVITKVIEKVLSLNANHYLPQPTRENFVLSLHG